MESPWRAAWSGEAGLALSCGELFLSDGTFLFLGRLTPYVRGNLDNEGHSHTTSNSKTSDFPYYHYKLFSLCSL
jgi:hypothetical protein